MYLRTPKASQVFLRGPASANSKKGAVCEATIRAIHGRCFLVRFLGPQRKVKARLVVTSEFGPKKPLNKKFYCIEGEIYNGDIKSMYQRT